MYICNETTIVVFSIALKCENALNCATIQPEKKLLPIGYVKPDIQVYTYIYLNKQATYLLLYKCMS